MQKQLATLTMILICMPALSTASEFLVAEPSNEAYNFVTHYRIRVDAPASQVWAHLTDLRSWMYEFEFSPIEGQRGKPGEVFRLYQGQDFKVQVTGIVPNEALTIVNLPITSKGELGTGIGVMTLHESGGTTEVSLTMSRRYSAGQKTSSSLRETRATQAFKEQTRTMWKDRFLVRLKELSEGTAHAANTGR